MDAVHTLARGCYIFPHPRGFFWTVYAVSKPDKISRILSKKRPLNYGHWSRFNRQPMISWAVFWIFVALILLSALG